MKQPGNLRRALKSGALYTLLLAALLVVIGIWGAGQVQRQVDDAQLAFLEGAIRPFSAAPWKAAIPTPWPIWKPAMG